MKRLLFGASALALALLLASCSQQASLSVQLGSTTGSVVRGDQVSVPVTVSNASGSVSLSVTGAPAGVTATLASSTLSGGATSTTLDVQVSAAAADGSATLTLNAVEGSNAASATFDLTITSLSVNGAVVDAFGNGMAGATVAIQGTTATTDANGAFTIGGVAVPYDLIVKQTSGGTPVAQVFEGLTSASPTVNTFVGALGMSAPPMSATISGNLSAAVATGFTAVVCVQSTTTWVQGCTSVGAGSTGYSFTPRWVTGASVPVTVHALEVATDSNAMATGYGRYGTATGTVSNGGTPTIDVTWGSTPSTGTIATSVNVPAGFQLEDVYGAAGLASSTTLPLFSAFNGSGLPSTFNTVVPQISSSGFTLAVTAYPGTTGSAITIGWKSGLMAGSSATLDLPTPPTLTAPADGATGVGVGSTLSLSGTGGGAATFLISNPSMAIIVTTTNASITIPDLSSVGMALSSGGTYSWGAIITPSASTPEDAAAHWIDEYFRSFNAVQNGGTLSSQTSGAIMQTDSRSFTAP